MGPSGAALVPRGGSLVGVAPGSGSNPRCTSCGAQGMPVWWVSEPYINLRLEDEPLGYQPARGARVSFQLSYRQRGAQTNDPAIFGVGNNWCCSFRAYLLDLTAGSPTGTAWLHRGGAGWITYSVGTAQYSDGSLLTTPDSGATYKIEYTDGSVDSFGHAFTNSAGQRLLFRTVSSDAAGHTNTFNYAANSVSIRLLNVVDPDGKTNVLYYENASFTNHITKVVDPYSRTHLLQYDGNGYLTNITDVAGLPSGLAYDAANPGWVTNLTTKYGSTVFAYGGYEVKSNTFYTAGVPVNRWTLVSLPTGGHHLFLYRQDCTSFMSATYASVPSTSPWFVNTFDNVDQYYRNSFHWDPLQYESLSTSNPTNLVTSDYLIGRLEHWLIDSGSGNPSDTLSLDRAPSPLHDGQTVGQITWYDYYGKPSGADNDTGASAMPAFVAWVLPVGGTTYFRNYTWNSHGLLDQLVETYSQQYNTTVDLRTNAYSYAANNLDLLQQIGPLGEQVVSNYVSNSFHQPDISYDALDQATHYAYNSDRRVTSLSLPSGLTTTNIYLTSGSDSGLLATTIDLQINRTNSYTYTSGLVYSHTDERGLATTNTWDNLQRLTSVTYPDGTYISNTYTNLDLAATKDRLGNWKHYGYNSIRQKVAETNALNQITLYNYCDCGSLHAVTNAWGSAAQTWTSYDYDLQGNRLHTYLPDATTLTNVYNSLSQVAQSGDGWTTFGFLYCVQGLRSATTNVNDTMLVTEYDAEDRSSWTIDANGVSVTNSYDALGRLTELSHPNGWVENFTYSTNGLIAYTNIFNGTTLVTRYGYDAAGRKTWETNANSEGIQFQYDPSGSLTNLIDGKGQSTVWHYDAYGRVTNKLDQASAQVLSYTYDADSRLASRWSAAKGTTYYTNDALGNLTYIKYPASPSVSFQYDALNRLQKMVDAAGTNTYSYTTGGLPWTEGGVFASDTVTNGYTNRKRVGLALQQPAGAWTNRFAYDGGGRLTNVTSQAGSFGYGYLAASASALPFRTSLPNTANITNAYDSMARLSVTALRTSGGTLLDWASYSYNQAGWRTAMTRIDGSTVNYGYDNIAQLKSAVGTGGQSTENLDYVYDRAWNLNWLTNGGSAGQFQVNVKNELTNWPHGACTYDANGNLTNGPMDQFGDVLTCAYDDENRLVDVQNPIAAWETQFVYDGLGRLRIRREYQGTGGSAPSGPGAAPLAIGPVVAEVHYLYDGLRVIQERDSNNVPQISYTRGNDLSQSLEGAGGIGGLLARSQGYSGGNWSTHNCYHCDGNGNITYLVNSSQGLAASYVYDPFGNTLSSSGGLLPANVYRFSSKEIHVNSGMYYYLCRFYDPSLQRWLNRDPSMENGGINLYCYVANGAANAVDPWGWSDFNAPPGSVTGAGPGPGFPNPNPFLPNPTQKPPGWNPTWPTGVDARGPYTQDPKTGIKYYPHPEDPAHWPHYDDNQGGRYPDKCLKPRPGQKRPPYGKQSPTNPWPQPPRPKPTTGPTTLPTASPILMTPGVPGLPTYPVEFPVLDPVLLDPIFVP